MVLVFKEFITSNVVFWKFCVKLFVGIFDFDFIFVILLIVSTLCV